MKSALIAGVNGQDGSYLAKILLQNNYKVIGLIRGGTNNLKNLNYLEITNKIILLECDLMDISQVISIIQKYKPNEIYNLAAQSSVNKSFSQPIGTFHFNTISVFNLLESIKLIDKSIKFYQASSSEMYGRVNKLPIDEKSVIHPLSPYAISKVAAHYTCINYREIYGLFICCGILFNHESYLRNDNFFVKKVIRDSIAIVNGEKSLLEVGNIDIKRDFGFAPKYVEAMYLMMQQDIPEDYIVCSGESVSLREIIYYVFDKLNLKHELCVVKKEFYRPTDIEDIYGTNEKAKKDLNWNYDLTFFDVLDILIKEELENYNLQA
jgi:GDPmannose 4,6-dehydratase